MRARDPAEPPRPPDLRLVPAALAAWAVVLLGIGFGPVAAVCAAVISTVGITAAALVLATGAPPAAGAPARATHSVRHGPAVLAAAGCAAAASVVVTAHTLLLVQHPLREPAERGAAATVRLVLRDDPRPIRDAAYGSSPGTASQVAASRRVDCGPGSAAWW